MRSDPALALASPAFVAPGLWLLLGTRLCPGVDPPRALGAVIGLVAGVGILGAGLVGVYDGNLRALAAIGYAAVWLVVAVFLFRHRRIRDWPAPGWPDASALVAGVGFVLAGSTVVALVILSPEGMSEGVSEWVGVAAGSVFVLAGVLVAGHGSGVLSADGLTTRILGSILLTAFAAVSMIFPPGGLIVAFIAVNGWIWVYRGLHAAATGRDPLAGLSVQRQVGVGCVVFLLLLMLVAGLAGWNRREPAADLPLEAPPAELR